MGRNAEDERHDAVEQLAVDVRDDLERLRRRLDEAGLAAACVLGDGTLEIARDVVHALQRALAADGRREALNALGRVAREQLDLPRRGRPEEVLAIRDALVMRATKDEQLREALDRSEGKSKPEVAGTALADAFVDMLIGLGDELAQVRATIGATESDLEARRALVRKAAVDGLLRGEGFSSDTEQLSILRAMFRAAGASTSGAESMTDFKRKRDQK